MPNLPKTSRSRTWLQFIVDHPFHIILPVFFITLYFAWHLPKLQFQTSIYDLAIEDLFATGRYKAFKKEFGTEEIILVVIKAENIFEPAAFQKIQKWAKELSRVKGVRRVISLPDIKKDMDVTEKWSLSDFERIIGPIELFQKNLISADRKTTVISLILEDIEEKSGVIASVEEVISRENKGLSSYQIGMPLVSKALAEYTEQDFLRLPPIAIVVIAFILFCFFKSFRGVLIPCGCVLMALIWTFGLMALTKTPLSMMTMIVPIFIIAVGTAYCLHIMAEYSSSIHTTDSPKEAAIECLSRIGFPTVLAVVTTTIGLGSLLLNRIGAIREFAIFSCFGIWSMLIIMLLLLPAILALLPFPQKDAGHKGFKKGFFDRILEKIVLLNLHSQRITLPIMGFLALLGIAGILGIKVETNPVGYFKEDSPVRRHFHDIYQDMAGSFPLNVVLDSKRDSYFEDPAHLMMITRIQGFLDSLEGVDKTISFADYFKLVNYASNQYEQKYYRLPEESFEARMLMNNYKTMLGQDMFDRFMNGDLSKANILMRTHISSSRDFLLIQKRILNHLRENYPKDFDFQVTGFGIVISQSSELLTKGQVRGLSLTLVLIFGIMFLLFLSIKVGLIAILPNCFPIIINYGFMGWLGIELSVVTSLIASIAIGLAVDDTIHYMVRYNREFKKDLDKERALRETIRGIGKPIIFTTITISLGFSILIFSNFQPTAIFGLMMVVTLFSALIGDLILLPALMTHVELVTLWDLLRLKLDQDPQKGIPLFSGLSRNQVHYILMAGALRNFKGGELLFRKGETSDSMYAVISGELEVVDVLGEIDEKGRYGGKKLIARIKPGDMVGEMGMIRSCQRSATVIVSGPTELLEINDRMVRRLHWLYPPTAQKFFFNLMSIICNKLEYTTQCLSDATTVDSLTGLPNRDYFMTVLDKEIDRAKRYGNELALFIMDVDNFQAINHTYEHEIGDRILSEVGQFFLKNVRKSDLAGHYGGQQFSVMLFNSPVEKARVVCERLKSLLSEHCFETHSGPVFTVSIGLVSLNAGRNETGADLIRMASQAIQQAKKSGKNRVEVYG